MKKILFLFFFVGLFQISMAQSVAIGLKGGLNFAKLDGNLSAGANYNNRTGYHAGAFVLVKLSKIGIQPEVILSKQGSTISVNSQNLNSNYSYINVPIILKLYTVAGINIQVGPQFGFLASAKQDIPNPLNGTITTEDVKSQLKGSDISAALGLGWDLPFGLCVDARYNLGLTKINNSAGSSDAKNQVIQVSVGYKFFKLGK